MALSGGDVGVWRRRRQRAARRKILEVVSEDEVERTRKIFFFLPMKSSWMA
jgi:hypothetical protein